MKIFLEGNSSTGKTRLAKKYAEIASLVGIDCEFVEEWNGEKYNDKDKIVIFTKKTDDENLSVRFSGMDKKWFDKMVLCTTPYTASVKVELESYEPNPYHGDDTYEFTFRVTSGKYINKEIKQNCGLANMLETVLEVDAVEKAIGQKFLAEIIVNDSKGWDGDSCIESFSKEDK